MNATLAPFAARKRLALEGTAHLNNIIYHDSGPYIASKTTFPDYFQKNGARSMGSFAIFSRLEAS